MKEKMTAFVLSVLLVTALSGCTDRTDKTEKSKDSSNSETYHYTYSTDPQDTTGNSSGGTQTPSMSAKDNVQKNARTRSWEQMLADGRID